VSSATCTSYIFEAMEEWYDVELGIQRPSRDPDPRVRSGACHGTQDNRSMVEAVALQNNDSLGQDPRRHSQGLIVYRYVPQAQGRLES
jgi:hypothetical protein